MTEPSVASQILGFTVFLTLAALAALLTPRLTSALHGVRRWLNREPINLDTGHPHCSVAACDQPATVWVHAGFDYWPMCETDALPYLTEGMRR